MLTIYKTIARTLYNSNTRHFAVILYISNSKIFQGIIFEDTQCFVNRVAFSFLTLPREQENKQLV